MPILGLSPFQLAASLEILANLSSLPPLILSPHKGLSYLLTPAAQVGITPPARFLAQAFGSLIATSFTIPLVLSLPSPARASAGDQQRGFRRATYITLGAGEVALATLMGYVWFKGAEKWGLREESMLLGAGNMLALLGVRALFLVVKPEWLEERGAVKKD